MTDAIEAHLTLARDAAAAGRTVEARTWPDRALNALGVAPTETPAEPAAGEE